MRAWYSTFTRNTITLKSTLMILPGKSIKIDDSYMSPVNMQENQRGMLFGFNNTRNTKRRGGRGEKTETQRGKTITNLTMSSRERLGMNY